MHYIIQILAVILIGVSAATLFGPRNTILFITSLIAVAFGVATMVVTAWWVLAVGTAALLIGQAAQRDVPMRY